MSPDEKYALKKVVYSFIGRDTTLGMPYTLELIDYENDTKTVFDDTEYNVVKVDWSPDSKYVSVSGGDFYYSYTVIISSLDAEIVDIGEPEVISYVRENFSDSFQEGTYTWYIYNEWVDDDQVKILTYFSDDEKGCSYEGYYIYDLVKQEIVEIEMNIEAEEEVEE